METYKTSDLGIATALAVKDTYPKTIEKATEKKSLFVYELDERGFLRSNNKDMMVKPEDFEDKYYNGEVIGSARRFFNEMKDLKVRIYS